MQGAVKTLLHLQNLKPSLASSSPALQHLADQLAAFSDREAFQALAKPLLQTAATGEACLLLQRMFVLLSASGFKCGSYQDERELVRRH